jgi:hypothetical protein
VILRPQMDLLPSTVRYIAMIRGFVSETYLGIKEYITIHANAI